MQNESAPVSEGDLLEGKYLVGPVLGKGGMGVVFAARHVPLQQRVALKFLLPQALRHPDVVARFMREARAAARIQSEHVARVIDVGELESGAPYIVMEYLDGENLADALSRRGPLPVAEAVDYLLQACEAIAEAHALGIIHRDLKPANLFLAKRASGTPTVKVLDFGISKLPVSAGDPALTETSSMFGSPPYMSPEQVTSTRSADARSDIWSLGVVLYELLTTRHPFQRDSVPALLAAILHQPSQPVRSWRADVSSLLDLAVMRCLEKDPARRFPDVAMFACAVGPFAPVGSAQSVERISHVLGQGGNVTISDPLEARGLSRSEVGTTWPAHPLSSRAVGPSDAPAPVGEPRVVLPPTAPSPPTYPVVPGSPAPAPSLAFSEAAGVTPPASPRARARRILLATVGLGLAGAALASYGLFSSGRRADVVREGAPAGVGDAAAYPTPAQAAPTAAGRAAAIPSPGNIALAASPAHAAAKPAAAHLHPGTADGRNDSRNDGKRQGEASAVCAELLARQGLGETLSDKEMATYTHACHK